MRIERSIAVATLVLVAAGCMADRPADDPAVAGEAPLDMPAAPVGEVAMVTLAEVGGSGITGDAAANHLEDEVRIGLSLDGLQPGETYMAHIHEGSCEAGGPVRVPLESVTAGEDGMGTSSTVVPADQLGTDAALFVQVHHPDGRPAACGNIEGHGS
jgi:hypothetical protein